MIPPQFDVAQSFEEGLATVMVNKRLGFIDKTDGRPYLIDHDGNEVAEGDGENLPRERDGKWGFVDQRGNAVIPFSYQAVVRFSEGRVDAI